jgi:hypothetical protein
MDDPLEQLEYGGRLLDMLGWLTATKPFAAPSTIATYLSSFRSIVHRASRWLLPRTPLLAELLRRLAQQPRLSAARPAKLPVTKRLLLLVALDQILDPAVRCAVLVAFNALWRVREYTAPAVARFSPLYTLARRHCFVPARDVPGATLIVHIPYSKSDATSAGHDVHFLPNPGDPCCPVAALRDYLVARDAMPGVLPTAPLFIKRSGAYVTRADITSTAALKRHADAAGLPRERVSSHGLRIGGCFALLDAGVPWHSVKTRGRWLTDKMVELYGQQSIPRLQVVARALHSAVGTRGWAPIACHSSDASSPRLLAAASSSCLLGATPTVVSHVGVSSWRFAPALSPSPVLVAMCASVKPAAACCRAMRRLPLGSSGFAVLS